jgi:hypothetical protein
MRRAADDEARASIGHHVVSQPVKGSRLASSFNAVLSIHVARQGPRKKAVLDEDLGHRAMFSRLPRH